MLKIRPRIQLSYTSFLEKKGGVTPEYRQHCSKWLRCYLGFCHKYQFDRLSPKNLGPFIRKLAQKKQTVEPQQQARKAIGFFRELVTTPEMLKLGNKSPSKESNTMLEAKGGVQAGATAASPSPPRSVEGPAQTEQANEQRIPASGPGARQKSSISGSTQLAPTGGMGWPAAWLHPPIPVNTVPPIHISESGAVPVENPAPGGGSCTHNFTSLRIALGTQYLVMNEPS